MERPSKKPFVVTIIILLLIILGLGGYIAYDYFIKDKDEVKVVTMIDDVNINLNAFYQISETLDKFDVAFNKPGTNYTGYIYNAKKIEAKDFDEKAALYVSLAKYLIPTNSDQTIVSGKVKGSFEKVFGDAKKYNPTSIDISNSEKINYDTNNESYNYTLQPTTNNYSSTYITKNTKTVLEEDKVIITKKIFFVEYNGSGNNATRATIYTNLNKQQKLGEVSVKNGEANIDEVLGKYGSRLATYEITFIKNSDEDYTFSQIEKIK